MANDYTSRVDLVQDLRFDIVTSKIKATPDKEFLIASRLLILHPNICSIHSHSLSTLTSNKFHKKRPRKFSQKLSGKTSFRSNPFLLEDLSNEDRIYVRDRAQHTLRGHRMKRNRYSILFVADLKELKDPSEALSLFEDYHERGFKHNYPSYSSLLYKLARSRRFEDIDVVLGHLQSRNIDCSETLFGALIQHYGKAHLVEKAVELFHRIPSFNCFRSVWSFNVLLNTLVDCGHFSEAWETFKQANKMGFRPNLVSYNIMIKAWIKNGGWEHACNLFDEMLKRKVRPSVVTYTSFLGVLCRRGEMDAAWGWFQNMIEKGHRPNAVTYALLMEGLCLVDKYKEAKKLMFDMEYRGCKPRPVNYGVLMTHLAKMGKINEAESLLNEMKKKQLRPDVVIYNILVNYLCKEGMVGDAYKILLKMQFVGCEPNAVTYRMIVDGFCNGGDFDGATKVLNATLKSGHCPRLQTLVCLVVGLLKEEKNDYACFVLEEMAKRQMKVDAEIWKILVVDACGQDGDIGSHINELVSSH